MSSWFLIAMQREPIVMWSCAIGIVGAHKWHPCRLAVCLGKYTLLRYMCTPCAPLPRPLCTPASLDVCEWSLGCALPIVVPPVREAFSGGAAVLPPPPPHQARLSLRAFAVFFALVQLLGGAEPILLSSPGVAQSVARVAMQLNVGVDSGARSVACYLILALLWYVSLSSDHSPRRILCRWLGP